jgi:hypothetical protein
MNPAQTITVNVVPYTGNADRTLWGIGSWASLASSSTWRHFEVASHFGQGRSEFDSPLQL